MIVIPEIKIKQLLDHFLRLIVLDYQENVSTPNNSYLYKIFGTNRSGNYNYFDQAVEILNRSGDHPRKLETRLFYDRSRAGVPTIHITLPQESPFANGIGFDTNYEQPDFDEDNQSYQLKNTRGFKTKYNIMITSSNDFEVLIVYSVIKAIIIGSVDKFEINGLRNINMSGQDLMMNQEISPLVYMRALSIDFFYEFTVPQLESLDYLNKILLSERVVGTNSPINEELVNGQITYYYSNDNLIKK